VKERRRYRRVTLRKPIRAAIGSTPVFVLDASRGGLRVAHQAHLPPPGSICRVEMKSDVGPIQVDCAIVHTVIQHAASAAKNLFYSGLQIVSADRQSEERVREIVENGGGEETP
jgi:hypothetical protein